MTFKPTQLSQAAFDELKTISLEEYGDTMTDDEIEAMGVRLLQLYELLARTPTPPEPAQPNDTELKVLLFLKTEISQGRSPSVRDLAQAMGQKSSRSGHRALQNLIEKGWMERDEKGEIRISTKTKHSSLS